MVVVFVKFTEKTQLTEQIIIQLTPICPRRLFLVQPHIVGQSKYGFVYKIESFVTSSGPYVAVPKKEFSLVPVSCTRPVQMKKPKVKDKILALLNRNKFRGLNRSYLEPVEYRPKLAVPKGTIMQLSEELLIKIFLRFTMTERCLVLAKVCRSWNSLLRDPIFWRHLEFRGKKVGLETILHLIKKCPTLESLRLEDINFGVERILAQVSKEAPDLKEIVIQHCKLTSGNSLYCLVESCPYLTTLDLKGTSFRPKRIFLELSRCKELKSLNIGGNKLLETQDLVSLVVNCARLEEFKMLHRSLMNRNPNWDQTISYIVQHFHHLKTLELDVTGLGSLTYSAIINNCSNLVCLRLTNCISLTGKLLVQFKSLTKLKTLKITKGCDLMPEDFDALFTPGALSSVEELDLTDCWRVGEGVCVIATTLIHLNSLIVANCKSITGRHLASLILLPRLKLLDISNCTVSRNEFFGILQAAPNLKTLIIDKRLYQSQRVQNLCKQMPFLDVQVNSITEEDNLMINIQHGL